MSSFRVAVAQILSGSDPEENLELVATRAADAAENGAQLVIFPEATMRRFGLSLAEVAEPVDGPWAQQLGKIAEHHQLVVVAGMFTPSEDGRVRNTLRALGPGVDAYYDKIHLFDAFGFRESDTVAPGTEPVMIKVGETNVGLTTCYDVRFPGLYIRLAELGAQVICVAASWGAGAGKVEQWQLLTRARALDSTSYLLAAGQADPVAADVTFEAGKEPNEQSTAAPTGVGYSAVISPRGEVLQSLGAEPGLLMVDLDLDLVEQTRAVIPVLANRRI
ncbi:MAG TPA: carbon-nitrogen hydrolase family protein [Propionibacteriaceae bacterium]|nr:carbon-nitrogen hydrolase family protein [Propionibacteriaceae bacterium]